MDVQSFILDLRQAFDLLDRNNDGMISRSEFENGVWYVNAAHSHTVCGYQTSDSFPLLRGYLPTSVVTFRPLQQFHYYDRPKQMGKPMKQELQSSNNFPCQTGFEVQTYEAPQVKVQACETLQTHEAPRTLEMGFGAQQTKRPGGGGMTCITGKKRSIAVCSVCSTNTESEG